MTDGNGNANEKQQALLDTLSALDSLLVAYSGGVDSAYLAWAAHRALGARALAVTAVSPSYSAHDREQAEHCARRTGFQHEFIRTAEFGNPLYVANNADRCYHCKSELFDVLDRLAAQRHFAAVAYGINADDTQDFRPGHRAAAEHRVLAPLLDARLTKTEIRELARAAGLPVWNRPASACLSSRVPYGIAVTPETLARIEQGEAILRELGFQQFRLRYHNEIARIEVARDEIPRAIDPTVAAAIAVRLKALGFTYVTLDLEGYRQGSLNVGLKKIAAGQ
ncbi:MAG: ATP-dependent sacrificial sulfur transferase LarE [Candidatus Acidiferrales bacterium]